MSEPVKVKPWDLGAGPWNNNTPGIVEAFADLAANRVPGLALSVRIHNAGKVARDARRAHGELYDAIIRPYVPEDADHIRLDPKNPDHVELRQKLAALAAEDVELDFGPPIDLSEVGERLELKPESVTSLLAVGAIALGE